MVKPYVRHSPLEQRRAAQRVSENNLPLNLALVGEHFAGAKEKVQPRPEFVADAASVPGSK